ncbi:ATP-binding protein [Paratractidigestivibacter sp.]|uniref:ATP-binding protein n=1 Tax=Paratractidigestivibacter sp. TaxID=2847316 RepID=UPI002ABE37D7|nr:ATP-binding protein [Paratractidigestivibacter sp.]
MTCAEPISLTVPAAPEFARVVRMCAASAAAVADLSLEDVEDVRMAAEEGFVYACATGQASVECGIAFGDGTLEIVYSLGEDLEAAGDDSLDLVEALLAAICEDFGVADDESGSFLVLTLRTGGAHDEH